MGTSWLVEVVAGEPVEAHGLIGVVNVQEPVSDQPLAAAAFPSVDVPPEHGELGAGRLP